LVIIPILEKYETLTKSEKLIADTLMSDPDMMLSKNAWEIAEFAGTSQATVVRFSRKIGFPGFSEMKVGLAKYLHNDHVLGEDIFISHGDSYETTASKLLAQINSICSTTAGQMDYTAFGKVVETIDRASNIYLFGVGASGITAADLQQKLIRIKKKAVFFSDSNIGILATMTYTPGDVAVAISYSGETTIVKHFIEAAGQQGATCIAITGNNRTSVAKLADLSLETPSIERKIRIGAVSSRYSQMFICDMIFLNLLIRYYDVAEELIRNSSALISKIK
jgi:DNA-binding MurR/RpiR family transcriptional regulator